ncbi:MAG: YceI family protein [Actinomycetota bacterium]|nr:YceI family protein [Actinomycetota bacterium]
MATFTWTSDSTVELEADSSVHPIHADIKNLRGEANVDVVEGKIQPGPGTSGWLEADVDQLLTGNKLEDMALRKQIDAKRYPTVRYEVRSVDGGPDHFKVTGTFEFHGQTRDFTESARAGLKGDLLTVDAEHTFDIQDFGVKPFRILSMKIHPEVTLKVHLIGTQASASTAWG